MNWKTLALCVVMAGFAGCGGPGGGGTDGGSDATMPDETRTYVIGLIDTDAPDPGGTGTAAYGFDLDGMMDGGSMTGCTAAMDFTSPITHSTAVDNQLLNALTLLGSMLGPDGPNGAIRDQIEAGKILLMLEVSGISSYQNDSSVTVHAVLGQVQPQGPGCVAHTDMSSCMGDTANLCEFTAGACAGTNATACGAHTDMASCAADTTNGCEFAPAHCTTTARPMPSAACTAHADQTSCEGDVASACDWSMANSMCTGIAAGQTFASLTDLGMVPGTIVNGRLEAVTMMLPLHLTASGRSIDLILRTVHFGGHISATTITGGEFGAQVLVSDIVTLARRLGVSVDLATIEGVVMPDLMPDATGTHCGAISAGMGYTAIAATLGH